MKGGSSKGEDPGQREVATDNLLTLLRVEVMEGRPDNYEEAVLIRGGHVSISLGSVDSLPSTGSVGRSRGSGRRIALRCTPADLKHTKRK